MKRVHYVLAIFTLSVVFIGQAAAADLFVGAESVDLTPTRPVLLQGQFNTRIARTADTPITANIVALESRQQETPSACAVIVSIDVCSIQNNLRDAIFSRLAQALPDFDAEKSLILAATHTHTSIATGPDAYVLAPDTPKDEILFGDEAAAYLADLIVPAIERSWSNRVPALYSFGLGNAVVAYNRRSVYENGTAVMYGNTNDPGFRKIEGMEDHDVGCVFFWNTDGKLLAMLINPSCPSQEVEGLSTINADFWHPVREKLHAQYGNDVVILGLCGAGGDMSPHVRYRAKAIDRMTQLRNADVPLQQARLNEIARRIVMAVDEVYPVVEPVKTADCPLAHRYEIFDVPQQKIPESLYEQFKKDASSIKEKLDADPRNGADHLYVQYNWTNRVVKRYEQQQGVENPTYAIGTHILRLGETVFCTNPFELYTDFAIQMKARSKATQTFVVQLCAAVDKAGYVPSAYAAALGGYGAIPQSNHVGAEGGQVFTDKTIEVMNSLFE